MNENDEPHGNRINPILAQLDLARRNGAPVDPRLYRTQIEECQLPERIGKIVDDLNRAAGYHVLEMMDFLPPQKTVLRVLFSKNQTDYEMEILLREDGAAVVFYSRSETSKGWRRYFLPSARKRNRTTFLDLEFHPADVLEENIESWLSYLLSGFEKKSTPSPMPRPSLRSGVRRGVIFGKASA